MPLNIPRANESTVRVAFALFLVSKDSAGKKNVQINSLHFYEGSIKYITAFDRLW